MKTLLTILKATLLIFLVGCSPVNEVNVYTSRHYDVDDILYDEFTKKTGITVNIISGSGGALMERLRAEGKNSPGDVFFTVDAGNLANFQKAGLLQSIESETIKNTVPPELRGPNNEWVAIAKRARVIFYNPDSVSAEDIENISYEDLADEKWKGRVVVRSSSNMYNQSLVASLISNLGISSTEIWANKFVNNFARTPQGNDRSQLMAVANGLADVAIANTYYIGIMLAGKGGQDQLDAAKKLKIAFPNQDNRGTHVNISGGGILKHSPNKDNAEKFLEFLLSEQAQTHIVNNSFEYPVIDTISPHPIIESFGEFKMDKTSVVNFGKFNPDAVKLMDRAGWK